MQTKKVAVIDMGTNTFHLLLAEIGEGDVEIILREKCAVKIGQGGIDKGYITPAAYDRALLALSSFKNIIDGYKIVDVYATATSAVRNARNGALLVSDILDKLGIRVSIISGEKEAELIYCGVKSALEIGRTNSLIMDVGGGSVEFILCNDAGIFWKGSFEIGAQRLVDKFHNCEPISEIEKKSLLHYLDEKLTPLFDAAALYKPSVLIGSSGSFDTLCEIDMLEKNNDVDVESLNEYDLSIDAYVKISQDIIYKNKGQRMAIPGMLEMRADMIVVACLLTTHVLQRLSLTSIRVSTYSLKEGVLSKIAAGGNL